MLQSLEFRPSDLYKNIGEDAVMLVFKFGEPIRTLVTHPEEQHIYRTSKEGDKIEATKYVKRRYNISGFEDYEWTQVRISLRDKAYPKAKRLNDEASSLIKLVPLFKAFYKMWVKSMIQSDLR